MKGKMFILGRFDVFKTAMKNIDIATDFFPFHLLQVSWHKKDDSVY